MARLWFSGCEWGDLHEFTHADNYFTFDTTIKRSGDRSLYLGANDGGNKAVVQQLSASVSEAYIRCCTYIDLSTNFFLPFIKWEKDGVNLGNVAINTSRQLAIYVNGSLKATSSTTLPYGAWVVIEARVKIDASGIIATRIDGVDDVSWSGDTTVGALTDFNQLKFEFLAATILGTRPIHIDDMAVNDITGSYNNSWCGTTGRIVLLNPNDAGTYTEWLPRGAVQNWQCVDEVPPDLGSTHCDIDVTNKKDSYNVENMPLTSSIIAVQLDSWPYKSREASIQNIKPFILTNSLIFYSSTVSPGYAYNVPTHKLWDINPATSLPWTVPDIDAIQVGVESLT